MVSLARTRLANKARRAVRMRRRMVQWLSKDYCKVLWMFD